MTPQPSDVWGFRSPTLPNQELKFKYHLCVSDEGLFLFVSTYKRKYRGSIAIPNSDFPFLTPTDSGMSQISCTTIIKRQFPDSSIPRKNPRGRVKRDVMKELLRYVKTTNTLTQKQKEIITEELYNYYGTTLD
ncbi:hypothetical protein OKW76_12505 [Sphingomonas sp. S1-29]|uniref:hypothetical protein n=1 Tax=Sphingomonas sp. S1-29 TaxID=2991074 RepID=UPI002240A6E5|nr:hypothetical protein [Sphingomonas sp. S1-29]UZK68851.1 hypothetical protein OKW76_12505 [Sphingomonas sp. S1-29]